MDRRISRRGCLVIFAVTNLAFWLVVAVAIGLIASDAVDLGVETYIRERRATAEAVAEHAPTWIAEVKDRVTAEVGEPEASSAGADAPETPTAGVNTPEPTMGGVDTPEPTVVGVEEPAPTTTGDQEPEPTMTGTEKATSSPPAPTPTSPQRPEPSPSPPVQATEEPGEPSGDTPTPQPPTATPGPTETPTSNLLFMSNPELDRLMGIDTEMERSAPGRPVLIRYREGVLNDEIATFLEAHPTLPYENVYLALRRDQIILTADVAVQGIQVNAELVGALVAQDCRPKVEIERLSTTGVAAPGFLKEQIEGIVQEVMDWFPEDYPLCVEQIVVEEGRMTIYGSRR